MKTNVLIIGNGGREHALAWKAIQSDNVNHIYVAPGNAGTAIENDISNVDIAVDDTEALILFAQENNIGLTIVGPEVPLVLGVVDDFTAAGLRCFGPTKAAAQLEGSKTFSKDFLIRHNIPTAAYQSFTETGPAIEYLHSVDMPIVIKADGLAAGKGVIIAQNIAEAELAVQDMLADNKFGDAGSRVVIEEFLVGEEASFIVIADGKNIVPMATSQDHKARDNGDMGPNTGGMGAYSPAPVVTPEIHDQVMQNIIKPTIDGMAKDGAPFTGFLYAGLMIDDEGNAKVLEYNVRFGDPETQPIMMRLKSDLIDLCNLAIDGKLANIKTEWDKRACLGVVLAAGGYPEKYSSGDVIKHIPEDTDNSKVFHAGTAKSDDDNIVTAGGRVLCACGLGNTILEAQKSAYQQVKNITSPNNLFCRDDIGFKAIG